MSPAHVTPHLTPAVVGIMARCAILRPRLSWPEYPHGIQDAAETLRAIVRRAVPDAIERVRGGWRLIGYEVPVGRRSRYFAYIAPEPIHIHLGFEYGAWMADPDGLLRAPTWLRKVRYTTFTAGQAIPAAALERLTREAARVALLSRGERLPPRSSGVGAARLEVGARCVLRGRFAALLLRRDGRGVVGRPARGDIVGLDAGRSAVATLAVGPVDLVWPGKRLVVRFGRSVIGASSVPAGRGVYRDHQA